MGTVAALIMMVGAFLALARWLGGSPAPAEGQPAPPGPRGPRRTRIGDLEAGAYVKVTGRVSGDATLRSPITHQPCVAYELRICLAGEPVACQAAATAIVVTDDSGAVRVDGRSATVRLRDGEEFSDLAKTLRGRKILARAGLRRDEGPYPATEAVLRPGDMVMVAGTVDAPSTHAPDAPYRAAAVSVSLVAGTDLLVISTPRRRRFGPGQA